MTGSGEDRVGDSSRFTVGLAVVVLPLLLSGLIVVRAFEIFSFNHDVAWILYTAGQMLDGVSLYHGIVEENPPLVFWLSMLPVALAKAVNLSPILAFNLVVGALVLISGVLVYWIHRAAFPTVDSGQRASLVGLIAAVQVLLPAYEFGQRENILFITAIPYVFAAAAFASGVKLPRGAALAVGLLAGLGFALKPYFLLPWLAIEAWLWIRSRKLPIRLENAVIVAVLVAYGLSIIIFSPGYFEMIEIAMSVYSAYGVFGSPALLFHSSVFMVIGAVLIFLFAGSRSADGNLRVALLCAMLGFLASALLQGKGWDYHYDPAAGAALVLVGVVLMGLRQFPVERVGRAGRRIVLALPLALALILNAWASGALVNTAWWAWGPPSQERTVLSELVEVVREHAWGQPVWFMSTSVVPAFPMVNLSEARWSSRFCCLWLLPGLYSPEEMRERPFPYHDAESMPPLERFLLDAVVEDLQENPPKLLIVDRSPDKQAFRRSDFEYLQYFLRDPRFSRFFRDYDGLVDIGPFRVYRRKGGAAF